MASVSFDPSPFDENDTSVVGRSPPPKSTCSKELLLSKLTELARVSCSEDSAEFYEVTNLIDDLLSSESPSIAVSKLLGGSSSRSTPSSLRNVSRSGSSPSPKSADWPLHKRKKSSHRGSHSAPPKFAGGKDSSPERSQGQSEAKTDTPSPSKKAFVSKYANTKPRVINRITALHDHAHSTAMFVFDIDETLVMSPHRGRLFTPEGMAAFESELGDMALPEAFKKIIIDRMQELLDQKVLVEAEHSAKVVRHLQQLGCWVFGLTSRYCTTAIRTHAMLNKLDIDFSKSSPLPADLSLQDPGTGAVYSRGVIYTNAMDKGYVLNRFLENVLLRDLWDASGTFDPSRNRSIAEGEEYTLTDDKIRVPSQIVFIDDRLSNSESVLQGLSTAEKFNIPVYSYHYTGATEDEDLVSATETSLCIDKPRSTKHGGCVGDTFVDIIDVLFPVEEEISARPKEVLLASLKKNKDSTLTKLQEDDMFMVVGAQMQTLHETMQELHQSSSSGKIFNSDSTEASTVTS